MPIHILKNDELNQTDFELSCIYIKNLDLTYIVNDMCSKYYSLARWTHQDAEYCCHLYKNFLILKRKHIEVNLVPTKEIDEFWHNHILYTKQYTYDCLKIFGKYLHHEPAVPTKHAAEKLINDFIITKQLYFELFKTQLINICE